jgi:hypothetical protein
MKTNDNGIDRDMTEDEEIRHLALAKVLQNEAKERLKDQADKATAKAALLDRLGITADEAALLLG